MHELDECLSLAKLIQEKTKNIEEYRYRAMSPKNQVITDMPKSKGSVIGGTDLFLIQVERLEQQKNKLCRQRESYWCMACDIFARSGIKDIQTIELMKYRYYNGLLWQNIIKIMQKKHGNWSESRCYAVHRRVLDIIDKK